MASDFPAWLEKYAALDDDALAALGNRGLVRRAAKQPPQLVSVGQDAIVLSSAAAAGSEQSIMITLTADGPTAARCDCPVGGICVHIIAAALWARSQQTASAPPSEAAELDVTAEVLGWEPAAVNRAVGIAAVRALAAASDGATPDSAATQSTIEDRGRTLTISWPGSPRIVFTAGAGVGAMIVAGQHSEAARKRWQLEAVIRLWRSKGRSWEWPDGVVDDGRLQPGEREAAASAVARIETLVGQGLAHLGDDAAGRLRGCQQRATLEDLGLLARLLGRATPLVAGLAEHRDDSDETDTVAALAEAWGLATALGLSSAGRVPDHLRGTRAGSPADVGRLVPLGVRWWTAANGSRGLTAHWWDVDHGRIEALTTGRAVGADPGFDESWELPLVWGASAQRLSAGPLTLSGAERREDGGLSPTTRTSIARIDTWSEIDLERVIDEVNARSADPALVGFSGPPPRIRIVRPGRGRDLALDEVNQQTVWDVIDRDGSRLELRLDANSSAARRLTSWLARKDPILGVVVGDGDRPDALIIGRSPQVVSLTLTPITEWNQPKRVRRRLERLRDQQRTDSVGPAASADPIVRLAQDMFDLVVALAVTGRTELSTRQRETLQRRIRQADDLGLSSVVSTTTPLLETATPPDVLRAGFLLNRLLAISTVDAQR